MEIHPAQEARPWRAIGEEFGGFVQNTFGFDGGTLLLLLIFGLGFSLCFHVSWMAVAEKLGGGIENFGQWIAARYAAAEDRKAGLEAAVKREEIVVQERARIVESHAPIQIVPQVVSVPKSERVEKEKQVSLFLDMPDTNLPPSHYSTMHLPNRKPWPSRRSSSSAA
jgi:DNA segregation ATPase FtsK/SpoIIIE, S-DNA-T family